MIVWGASFYIWRWMWGVFPPSKHFSFVRHYRKQFGGAVASEKFFSWAKNKQNKYVFFLIEWPHAENMSYMSMSKCHSDHDHFTLKWGRSFHRAIKSNIWNYLLFITIYDPSTCSWIHFFLVKWTILHNLMKDISKKWGAYFGVNRSFQKLKTN